MKILEATVIVDGKIMSMDVIEHQGAFWLVPEWLDNIAEGVSMPRRIVSLATIPHEKMSGNPDFVVSYPVPKSVFDGTAPSEIASVYVVKELPEIRVPIPPKLH